MLDTAAPASLGPYTPNDAEALRPLLATATLAPEREARIDAQATHLIEAIRATAGLGGVEEILRQYALDTGEGLALMVLAEALLRIPDPDTADRLIEDRLGSAEFGPAREGSGLLVNASAWALGLFIRVIQPGQTPEGVLAALTKRIGLPTVRTATRQAMRIMGSHFVLGQTIAEALTRATSRQGRVYRYSFDMLGEGARTAADAARYAASYANAIEAIGRAAGNQPLPGRPGISVKLSALHPRYEAISHARVMAELVPIAQSLARAARAHDLNFTIDAEEQDRLELSLDVIDAIAADSTLANWDGFGLAIQAYGKRALATIDHIAALAERLDRRFMVRLVKGAYWDTEIKRAQERGLDGYPVWTRKPATDLLYLAAADRLLALRPRLYPQFATHNALTVAAILERAGNTEGPSLGGFEFQRLHGMGEALYATLLHDHPAVGVRTYAPVGGHADLLAYLVRRLLENGANSSFVSQAADPAIPIPHLLTRPATALCRAEAAKEYVMLGLDPSTHAVPSAPANAAEALSAPNPAQREGVESGVKPAHDGSRSNDATRCVTTIELDPTIRAVDPGAASRQPGAISGFTPTNPNLPLPENLYAPRRNSRGLELGHRETLTTLLAEIAATRAPAQATPLIDGHSHPGPTRPILNPATGAKIGTVTESPDAIPPAIAAAQAAHQPWDSTPATARAATLERAADLFEAHRPRLLALLIDEAGKTLDDALSELREATDFLRYYAAQSRLLFTPEPLPGPTGETNTITRHGRGPWACISPWNFPLAIFTGQVAAALAAGNPVLAKPAQQTPLIAAEAVRLLHEAGVPPAALALLPGGAEIGAALIHHPQIAGVAFTGSTETAWRINQALAAKRGPIGPLIAETGGINAMVVDATALPEQVADDVVTSAFRSAGQRCSALRLLCIQSDVADRVIAMIAGAAAELRLGDPADPATHIGPVIDAEAKARLDRHIAHMAAHARTHLASTNTSPGGHFVAPHLFELARPEDLGAEIFGPILHVVRWQSQGLSPLLDALANTGYGLTLGIQSRNETFVGQVLARVPAGNAYVNRSMIGAVVGTQPFGGQGLSGTGPKAGGPDYLRRFALERVVTINTAAAGGNAALLATG